MVSLIGEARARWLPRLWAAGVAAASLASCGDDSQVPGPDPCTLLGVECPNCTDPAAKAFCNMQLMMQDAVQCTVGLDDPRVRASCSADGGATTDATLDAADAGPPPPCGGQLDASATCSCATDCSPGCGTGGCGLDCLGGATCSPTCTGGKCNIVCESGSNCEGSCAGGGCTFDCKAGSMCANSCAGGNCVFSCEEGSICNNTCAPMNCTP